MHHDIYFVHASYSFCFFCANLQSALGFVFFLLFVLVLILEPFLGKLELIGFPLLHLCLPLGVSFLRTIVVERLLNSKRKMWAKRFVILDEVDLAIRANLESKGWLSLLEIDHPPPTALNREFFSNLSYHVYDSNTLVRSWIRGVEFTITPRVVAEALRFQSLWSLSIPMPRLLH